MKRRAFLLGAAVITLTGTSGAKALVVFDPSNFAQNLQQVAESVKAFYQRNQQLINLIQTAASTARSVQSLENGNFLGYTQTLLNLAGVDQQYSGMLRNGADLINRSNQLMDLASRISSPEDALAASQFAQALAGNVINDSAELLASLEPLSQTTQKLSFAMTASQAAVGETQAIQAQTQLSAVNTQLNAQRFEIERLQLANQLARDQRNYIQEQEAKFRIDSAIQGLRTPTPRGSSPLAIKKRAY